jgi:hypothetical protein
VGGRGPKSGEVAGERAPGYFVERQGLDGRSTALRRDDDHQGEASQQCAGHAGASRTRSSDAADPRRDFERQLLAQSIAKWRPRRISECISGRRAVNQSGPGQEGRKDETDRGEPGAPNVEDEGDHGSSTHQRLDPHESELADRRCSRELRRAQEHPALLGERSEAGEGDHPRE